MRFWCKFRRGAKCKTSSTWSSAGTLAQSTGTVRGGDKEQQIGGSTVTDCWTDVVIQMFDGAREGYDGVNERDPRVSKCTGLGGRNHLSAGLVVRCASQNRSVYFRSRRRRPKVEHTVVPCPKGRTPKYLGRHHARGCRRGRVPWVSHRQS